MTLTSPPYVLQGSPHTAQLFRESLSSLLAPAGGIVQASDFALTQNGSPNMSVNVGAGRIWIPGTSLATVNPGGGAYYPQGAYYAESDAAVNLAISASDPSNPRIDTVICQVQDAAYVGVTNSAALAVVTGTPTAGATLVNLNGKGAVPASSMVIGYVLAPANATSIVTADLSSVAAVATFGLGNALHPPVPVAVSSTLAPGAAAIAAPSTTQTLPAPQPGALVEVIANASVTGATNVTVLASGAAKIFGTGLPAAGATSFPLGAPGASAICQSDGTNWYIVAGQQDTGWLSATLGTNITTGVDAPFSRLMGNRVWLRGVITNSTGGSITSTATTLLTVAVSCQPTAVSFITAAQANSTIMLCEINSAGLLTLGAASPSWANGANIYLDNTSYWTV